METYNFLKTCNKSILESELAKSNVWSLISNIECSINLCKITATRSLTESEYSNMYNYVINHHAPSQGEQIATQRVKSAIAFGQSILVEVAVENIMLGLTSQQIIMMLTKFGVLKQMLETGSLYTALAALEKIPPDQVMDQERLTKYANKIKQYLGLL